MAANENEMYVGTCTSMCPTREIKMRKEHRLIHKLELADRPGSRGRGLRGRGRHRPMVADTDRMVKEYSRPAAGKVDPRPDDLRTPETLIRTVNFLLNQVVTRKDVPWYVVYEYVFDRLRAVRQDMVIQRIEGQAAITALERTIRFLVFSNYRLCEENMANFDTKINETHLQECLKWLICLYEEAEGEEDVQPYVTCHRAEFVSIYLLFNLGHREAMQLALEKKTLLGTDEYFQRSLSISLAWLKKNYVRVFREARMLSVLMKCAFHRNIPLLYRESLGIMSAGYSSKALRYPLQRLATLLCADSPQGVATACASCGVTVEQEHVRFSRQAFSVHDKIKPSHLRFIDVDLDHETLPSLMSSTDCQCTTGS